MIYKFVAFLLSIVCSISRQHLFSVNCVEDKMEHYCVLYVCRVKHVMYTQAHVARVRKVNCVDGITMLQLAALSDVQCCHCLCGTVNYMGECYIVLLPVAFLSNARCMQM